MFKYPDEDVFVQNENAYHRPLCPKCKSTVQDIGTCSEGCCDKYSCTSCSYRFTVEALD